MLRSPIKKNFCPSVSSNLSSFVGCNVIIGGLSDGPLFSRGVHQGQTSKIQEQISTFKLSTVDAGLLLLVPNWVSFPRYFYKMWFSLPQTWVIFSHLFTFAIQKLSNGKLIERMWTYIAQLISWQMRVGTKPCWLYLVLEPLSLKSLPAFSASSSHSDVIISIFETLTHVRPLLLLALWIWKTLSSIPPHHLALPTSNHINCKFTHLFVLTLLGDPEGPLYS